MSRSRPSLAASISLEAALARLARHAVVDGLVVVGSRELAALTPVSDYDLVVVLARRPAPLRVGLATIDGRLTDLLFVTTAAVDAVAALDAPVPYDSWLGRTVEWLRDGEHVFDRAGRLARAREHVSDGDWLAGRTAAELHAIWFRGWYDLRQTRRLLESDDPVHQLTVDMRLLYSVYNAWTSWFEARGLRWQGDKAAIRHLERYDPAFLRAMRTCLAATDRHERFRLYAQLTEQALAPLGSPPAEGATMLEFEHDADVQLETVSAAFAFWDALLVPREPA
jgi:hypothetical protein